MNINLNNIQLKNKINYGNRVEEEKYFKHLDLIDSNLATKRTIELYEDEIKVSYSYFILFNIISLLILFLTFLTLLISGNITISIILLIISLIPIIFTIYFNNKRKQLYRSYKLGIELVKFMNNKNNK